MRAIKRLRLFAKNRDGSPAVEFALVLPLFLMMTLGIIELASYAMTQEALKESVHEVGRYAIVHGSQSSSPATAVSLQTLVQNNSALLSPSQVSATVTFSPNNSPGSTVSIVATCPWVALFPFLNIPSTTVKATSISTILN